MCFQFSSGLVMFGLVVSGYDRLVQVMPG